ncbi:MAG: type II secretion system protein [Ilumatobacteraceae bacterium]
MHERTIAPAPAPAHSDDGFTLVELLIVIVVLGVLATVTVFAVRGITNQGEDSAVAADERTLAGAQEAYMAQNGAYATEAELVAAGLLRDESTLHDVDLAVGAQSYEIVADGAGGGGGGGGPVALGTPTTWAGIPAMSFGSGTSWVVIGGATTIAEWNALVAGNQSTTGNTMIFVNVADITTPAIAEAVHDASIPFARVISSDDDIADFSGGLSMSLYMEQSNGFPAQTYTKIHGSTGRDVAWAFAN